MIAFIFNVLHSSKIFIASCCCCPEVKPGFEGQSILLTVAIQTALNSYFDWANKGVCEIIRARKKRVFFIIEMAENLEGKSKYSKFTKNLN
jgi:hypothetical protein